MKKHRKRSEKAYGLFCMDGHQIFFKVCHLKIIGLLFLGGLLLAQMGCMQKVSIVPSAPPPIPPVQPEDSVQASEPPSPRMLASMELTEQARILLDRGRSDDAIRVLERAISIDSNNGRNYFYMAEAWLHKGNKEQAKEFNRIAEIYLRDDPEWRSPVNRQRDRIRLLQK